MNIRSILPPVVLAEDLESLSAWYATALNLEIRNRTSDHDGYTYLELWCGNHAVIGMARASQMGVSPISPRQNTVIPQLRVPELERLFQRIWEENGKVLFGPSYDPAHGGYYYGGFVDPEGNQFWVVDRDIDRHDIDSEENAQESGDKSTERHSTEAPMT